MRTYTYSYSSQNFDLIQKGKMQALLKVTLGLHQSMEVMEQALTFMRE